MMLEKKIKNCIRGIGFASIVLAVVLLLGKIFCMPELNASLVIIALAFGLVVLFLGFYRELIGYPKGFGSWLMAFLSVVLFFMSGYTLLIGIVRIFVPGFGAFFNISPVFILLISGALFAAGYVCSCFNSSKEE